ncbi:MAG: hypothetical protein JRN51_10280 [Nitrososphaerota archaeon]|nr:hypothetical protein [Nitrososphaerota archaeon]
MQSSSAILFMLLALSSAPSTPPERAELWLFYEFELRQAISFCRMKSEPVNGQLKDVFGIDPLPVRGLAKASRATGTNLLSRARWTSGGGSWRSKSETTASSHTQETTIPRSLDHHKMPREET